jgi:acyl-CoA reductase-like NAD-dependent aldehyde dehydrogenase
LAVCNPATEETLIQIEVASKNDIENSIDDAQNVFTSGVWSRADLTERFLVLNRVAALLRKHSKELAARIP